MNHTRYDVITLAVNGDELPLLYADVVVVARDNTDVPDWECVAATRVDVALELAPYALRITTIGGPSLTGDAIMVRTDGRGHVFRGVGALVEA